MSFIADDEGHLCRLEELPVQLHNALRDAVLHMGNFLTAADMLDATARRHTFGRLIPYGLEVIDGRSRVQQDVPLRDIDAKEDEDVRVVGRCLLVPHEVAALQSRLRVGSKALDWLAAAQLARMYTRHAAVALAARAVIRPFAEPGAVQPVDLVRIDHGRTDAQLLVLCIEHRQLGLQLLDAAERQGRRWRCWRSGLLLKGWIRLLHAGRPRSSGSAMARFQSIQRVPIQVDHQPKWLWTVVALTRPFLGQTWLQLHCACVRARVSRACVRLWAHVRACMGVCAHTLGRLCVCALVRVRARARACARVRARARACARVRVCGCVCACACAPAYVCLCVCLCMSASARSHLYVKSLAWLFVSASF